jgi:hypothetical protein
VASCSAGEPCTVGLPTPMEPWSYDFASDELDAVTPDPIDGGNRLWLVNHPLGPQGQAIGITTLTIATVPEPGTAALLAMGLVALCVWRTASG